MRTPSLMFNKALSSREFNVFDIKSRTIAIGTDMISSVISLQRARPWYVKSEQGSNLAVDNAVTLKHLFAGRTVTMFGVPAPFTGTCSNEHYPGYKELADAILKSGSDEIVCYSVSDPYAHNGWQVSLGNDASKITFLADPDASFARAYGLAKRFDDTSLGERSARFSMIVKDGVVQSFKIVSNASKDAEENLSELKQMNGA